MQVAWGGYSPGEGTTVRATACRITVIVPATNVLAADVFLTDIWCHKTGRLRLKYDGTRAETIFRLSTKRASPFKSTGASVQSTTGSRGVRISGSSAGDTMFQGCVKSTGYPLHSPVPLHFPSRASPCAITFQLDSTSLISFASLLFVPFPTSSPSMLQFTRTTVSLLGPSIVLRTCSYISFKERYKSMVLDCAVAAFNAVFCNAV